MDLVVTPSIPLLWRAASSFSFFYDRAAFAPSLLELQQQVVVFGWVTPPSEHDPPRRWVTPLKMMLHSPVRHRAAPSSDGGGSIDDRAQQARSQQE